MKRKLFFVIIFILLGFVFISCPLPEEQEFVAVTGLLVSQDTLELLVNTAIPGFMNSSTLVAIVIPANATSKIKWASSDISIAKVNQKGLVTAVAAGTAKIGIISEIGGFTATCDVTVIDMGGK